MPVSVATEALRCCACLYLEPEQVDQLQRCLGDIEDWDELVAGAEQAGLSNLLYYHLKKYEIAVPGDFLRQLKALTARHRRAHRTRTRALVQILDRLAEKEIDTILLKGAALARMLYPQPELRPMGDIDLLVPGSRALEAQQALREIGYAAEDQKSGYMFDHHHLPGATMEMEGILVYVEMHHDALSGDVPGSLTFDNLSAPPLPFEVEGRTTASLGHVDQLRHLCHHAFEPVRIIKLGAIADIFTYSVRFDDDIDWDLLHREHPFVVNTLQLLHYVCPMPASLRQRIGLPRGDAPQGTGRGFTPLSEIMESGGGPVQKFGQVFNCPDWWLHVYYEVPADRSLLPVKVLRHPARVTTWLGRRLGARFRSRHIG